MPEASFNSELLYSETILHGFLRIKTILLFYNVFSRMFKHWPTLENNVFLWIRGQICFLSSIIKIICPFGKRTDLLVPHYTILEFPKLKMPQLWHKPVDILHPHCLLCVTPVGTGEWRQFKCDVHSASCAMNKKDLCLWPRSLCLLPASMK